MHPKFICFVSADKIAKKKEKTYKELAKSSRAYFRRVQMLLDVRRRPVAEELVQ